MSSINSKWRKGSLRYSSESVTGSWNRTLQEKEHAPTERAYLDTFIEHYPFKRGARIRRK